MIGYDSDSYSISAVKELNSIYISPDGVNVSYSSKTGNSFNSITLNANGILLNRNGEIK